MWYFTFSRRFCRSGLSPWRGSGYDYSIWCGSGSDFFRWIRILIKAVLRIRDVYPGSRIRMFPSRTGSNVKMIPDPRSGSTSTNLSILTRKIVSKLSEIWSRMFITNLDPGTGSWFFTHPGFRGQKGTGFWDPDSDPQYLKVPKRENFSLAFFALNEPFWVCYLGTGEKNRIFY